MAQDPCKRVQMVFYTKNMELFMSSVRIIGMCLVPKEKQLQVQFRHLGVLGNSAYFMRKALQIASLTIPSALGVYLSENNVHLMDSCSTTASTAAIGQIRKVAAVRMYSV